MRVVDDQQLVGRSVEQLLAGWDDVSVHFYQTAAAALAAARESRCVAGVLIDALVGSTAYKICESDIGGASAVLNPRGGCGGRSDGCARSGRACLLLFFLFLSSVFGF